jgi:hypothetical protein
MIACTASPARIGDPPLQSAGQSRALPTWISPPPLPDCRFAAMGAGEALISRVNLLNHTHTLMHGLQRRPAKLYHHRQSRLWEAYLGGSAVVGRAVLWGSGECDGS